MTMTQPTTTSDIMVQSLTQQFETEAGSLTILKDVHMDVNRGESVVITGPSGSGKSTLLYILGTLQKPTSGHIQIMGVDPFKLSAVKLAQFRSQHIGFIFQEHQLLPQCTVWENVLLPQLTLGGVTPAAEARAKQLLEQVGLEQRQKHHPAQLSGGERQRVAICRALINQPEMLLADEPTGSLDPHTADVVGKLMLEISSREKVTLICVTHSMNLAGQFPRHLRIENSQLIEG